MDFERYVCWESGRADVVMEIEAELSQPAIFTAVHTDEPLETRRTSSPVRSAQDFLDAFVAPANRDIRAVVIGDVGSGKSHLVHWVELNLPERDDLRIVSVPRSGTSLRWIVKRLINELPPEDRQSYEQKLILAPDSAADVTELQRRLIAELGIVLGRAQPSDEVDEALADGLQAFLNDPVLREYHVGENGIIADLVRHITEPSNREGREARRRFEESDLKLDVALRRAPDLSQPARTFLRVLESDRGHQARAVELVNAHLDAAVTRTLGFTGGELTQLLNDIRRHLLRGGQQLVLLVEDLVRAEGIDRALIDALIENRDDLCQLRLLIAVTTGYYETGMIPTQKDRFEFIIDMDQRPPLDQADRLAPFSARYLNALRATPADLEAWYETRRSGARADDLPNACRQCPYTEPCHEAFGAREIEGAGPVGLYPFTTEALDNMAARARDRSPNPEFRFGPRELLRDVLLPVVSDIRAGMIRSGTFPDQSLVESHGRPLLPLEVQTTVRAQGGAAAERQLALLELWSAAPREATALPAGIYQAFNLPPAILGGPPTPVPPPVTPPKPEPVQPLDPGLARLRQRQRIIESWANGGPMTEITNDLRGLIYEAATALIDWDGEALERTVFAGAGRGASAFQRRSIDFRRQDTRAAAIQIKLLLPLEDTPESRLATGRALQGLLAFEYPGRWDDESGAAQFLVLSEELPKWADSVLSQVRRVADPDGEWDPVSSAIEVLAVGAALASRPPQRGATALDRLDALFGPWPEPGELQVRSVAWRRLYEQIYRRHEEMRGIVLAHASAMKGGRSGAMLDAAPVIEALRTLTRRWQLSSPPPSRLADTALPDRYVRLVRLHASLQAELSDAIRDERDARLEWLDGVREDLPDGTGRREFLTALDQARAAVLDYGLEVRRGTVQRLDAERDSFAAVQLDEAIRITDDLRAFEGEVEALLPLMASGRRGDALDAADRFLPLAREFLSEAASQLASERERIPGAREVGEQFGRIGAALEIIEQGLVALAGSER